MAERRRGLGRGIAALIPDNQREQKDRPIDIFFGGEKVAESENVSRETSGMPVPATPDESGSTSTSTRNSSTSTASSVSSTRKSTSKTKAVASKKSSSKERKPVSLSEVTPPKEGNLSAGQNSERSKLTSDGVKNAASFASTEENKVTTKVISTKKSPVQAKTTAQPAITPSFEELTTSTTAETEHAHDENDELVAVPGATYAELPLEQIVPNQKQPRTVFDEDDLNELATSIREVGVLQPVIVRPLSEPLPDHPEARYELIMGERRWRASRLAGAETVPTIIRRTADEDLLRDALLENLHRAQLNPLEEAAAYQQLLDDFSCTQEELARRIARSRPQISNTLRLLKLPPLVQKRVAAQVLSAGHARALLGLSDPAAMERLAQRIVAEGLSVRAVEEIVALGEEPLPENRVRRTRVVSPHLQELAGKLADHFDTKVAVNMGKRKGSIKIDFASLEDLNRILEVLAPESSDLRAEN